MLSFFIGTKNDPKSIDRNPGRRLNYIYGTNGLTYNDMVKEQDKNWKRRKTKAEHENNQQSIAEVGDTYNETESHSRLDNDSNKELSILDKMRLKCLQYGGEMLDTYDWSLRTSETEKQSCKNNYDEWSRRCEKTVSNIVPLNIKNIHQFKLNTMNNRRRAVVAIAKFEFMMKNVTTLVCKCCHEWSMVRTFKDDYICDRCKANKHDKTYFIKKNYQPIWYDDKGDMRWSIPTELQDLSLQEELLIQRNAPYIPILHLYNGSLGLKGHCVVFERESSGDINKLPRCKSDIVHFNRQYGCKSEGKEQKQMFIKVRRKRIIEAIQLLQKIHSCYKDVILDEGVTMETKNVAIDDPTNNPSMKLSKEIKEDDEKISSSYCHDADSSGITYSCIDDPPSSIPTSNKNISIIKDLRRTAETKKQSIPVLNFPPTSENPIW